MNFVVDDPTAESVAQSRAFQLTLPARSITLHGSPSRPLCDVLLYGVPFVARYDCAIQHVYHCAVIRRKIAQSRVNSTVFVWLC
jgi:hypothetical protein